MLPQYQIQDTSAILSPGLVFFKELIEQNIARAVAMVDGDLDRLRPHVKTHKTREIIRMQMAAGISKFKVATLAEAEMVASCGAPDVFLAYNLVGPNCARLAKLIQAYPNCKFSVHADHPVGVESLSKAMVAAGTTVDVLLDCDVGQHRTGIAAGPEAAALYEKIHQSPGLRAGGFHVYDGHNHQETFAERQAAVLTGLQPVLDLRAELEKRGMPVSRLVLGGTPTFPVYAQLKIPGGECSPGTCFLHDNGYGTKFQDISGFKHAALVLTRVISRPTPTRLTLDLGYKAIASDPPAGKRCILPDLPNAEPVLQNEEHLVLETPDAGRFQPGDELFALPTHICPTCAMHKQAYVVEGGQLAGTWEIVARDRMLTV